jgi:WD40 repeat protein
MKTTNILLGLLLSLSLALSGCNLLGQLTPQDPTPQSPTLTQAATEEPIPLVTYTPTEEAEEVPTETPVAATEIPPVDKEAPISIDNYQQLTVIEQISSENAEEIAWGDSPDAPLSVIADKQVITYDQVDLEEISSVTLPEEMMVYEISPFGNYIAVTNDMMTVQILNARTLDLHIVIDPQTPINRVHFSPDETRVLISSMDEWAAIEADLDSGAILQTYRGFETAAPVYDVIYSHYTDDIVWIARGTAQVQNRSNQAMSAIFGHEDWISSFSIDPARQFLAIGTAKTTESGYEPGIQLWDLNTGIQGRFIASANLPNALFFSRDGSVLIGTDGVNLNIWNPGNGQLLQSFSGHLESIYRAVLSPDGGSVLTISFDQQMILWQLRP